MSKPDTTPFVMRGRATRLCLALVVMTAAASARAANGPTWPDYPSFSGSMDGVPVGLGGTLNCDKTGATRITIRAPADARLRVYGPMDMITVTVCVLPGYTLTVEPAK